MGKNYIHHYLAHVFAQENYKINADDDVKTMVSVQTHRFLRFHDCWTLETLGFNGLRRLVHLLR